MLEKKSFDEWKSEETSQDMQDAEEADTRKIAQPKRSVTEEEDLICKALVKEIGRTSTWLGVVEAWQALLRVRRMARGLQVEHNYHLENCGDGVENKKEME